MKNTMMSAQYGLASAFHSTTLPCGSQAILTVGAAAQLQQEQSARVQIVAGRPSTLIAFPAAGAPAVRIPDAGGYAPTKHARNGGLRGPYPWRQPPVIT
ncbi:MULTISPECIES: hypothetical protein [Streptosporangium]|uniref:Uncharacterized protein n=1 Tax=Streptosporangium brasiliense TaxID=47480 RepID=A0ABT9R7L2_9ACTN|nr:hypothetical protein [Streptosporangium brasiliense]MDP9865227.1 hypothetical protein [Streptosporangium brasiliense]